MKMKKGLFTIIITLLVVACGQRQKVEDRQEQDTVMQDTVSDYDVDSYPIRNDSFTVVCSSNAYDEFLHKHLRYDPTVLAEHLENNFSRITLVNKGKTERLTIDTDLKFHNLENDCRADLTGLVIIELKRDGLRHSPILGMLRELRIKPSGFSKYCMGSALTNPSLKRNNFKERLRMVERMLAGLQ